MHVLFKTLPAMLVVSLGLSHAANAGPHFFKESTTSIIKQQHDGLPLKLIAFAGKPIKDIISFNWSTMNEKNVNRFELEKSADGTTFTTINKQTAKGISNTTENYKAEDFKPNAGDNYYRLKVVTNDGSISYSKTIRIKF
ncbi:MAG: hypothetical protein QM726_11335 [Chitinophagaceae bacterium]